MRRLIQPTLGLGLFGVAVLCAVLLCCGRGRDSARDAGGSMRRSRGGGRAPCQQRCIDFVHG
jgi:hypothetical protein